jgi:hypothetical protein
MNLGSYKMNSAVEEQGYEKHTRTFMRYEEFDMEATRNSNH